jgi:hypothetical protein
MYATVFATGKGGAQVLFTYMKPYLTSHYQQFAANFNCDAIVTQL